jgi:large subunit ribosomal protein L25
MAQPTLSARIRERTGKGAARKLRKQDQIPAIFYGPGSAPVMLSVNDSDLKGILRDTSSENIILTLQIESDKGKDVRTVMLKEIQAHPFKPVLFHADFYEVSMDKELTVDIAIHLVNTPEGVTKGGVLQQIRRELNVSALPSKLVDFIEVDVSGLDIGDAIHAGSLQLPEGILSNEEDDVTIAVVSAPTVEAEEVVEEEVEEEVAEAAEAEAETEESGERG